MKTSKKKLKKVLYVIQDGKSMSGKKLDINVSNFDTHRKKPKAQGGTYDDISNVEAITPVEHLKLHGNYREREEAFEELKILVERRNHYMKLRLSLENKISACKTRKVDKEHSVVLENFDTWKKDITSKEKAVMKEIPKLLKLANSEMVKAAENVKGLGPIGLAYLLVYIDINIATNASKVWKYVGLDKASHERYTKGVKSGGNKILRSIVWNVARSMLMSKSPYADVYYRARAKIDISEKITKSYNTQGNLITCAWKDTKPCHRNGYATRKVMKHFLADFWYVYRKLNGLSTRPLWIEEKAGHTSIIKPEERGWEF